MLDIAAPADRLDSAAIDQSSEKDMSNHNALHAFISNFHHILHSCPGGVIVVADVSRPQSNPATRAWCTFEW